MSSFHWKPQSALKKDQDRINQLPFSLLEAEIAVPVLDWERQQGEQHFFFTFYPIMALMSQRMADRKTN